MPNGENQPSSDRGNIIAQRIGPIFDPAFLKLISKVKMQEIILIQLEAQVRAQKEALKATEAITKIVREMKLK